MKPPIPHAPAVWQSLDARTRQPWGEPLPVSSADEVEAVAQAAAAAAPGWAASSGVERALLLRSLAAELQAQREPLVALADRETALGPARLQGELDRTAFQLRRFADLAEAGAPLAHLDDPAVPGAPPAGHPALQRVQQPLGPVAVFAASNFPFAFSVLGGDTASALAAGCPVVVKAHPGHPALSLAVRDLARACLQQLGLPAGLIGQVQGPGHAEGVQLLQHPAIAAAAFTGSTRGGQALQAVARSRARPIPFFGELGSINPVLALPSALRQQGPALSAALAGSIALGCGQFCTSPGLLVLVEPDADTRSAGDALIAALVEGLRATQLHPMLTPGMRAAFEHGVAHWRATPGLRWLLADSGSAEAPRAVLAQAEAADVIAQAQLREEVFGPAALVVRVADVAQAVALLQAVGGTLTVTLWGAETDTAEHRAAVRAATQVAGRVLFGGMPTGVAVTAGQQHGGPWPSSTEPASTSVGDAALQRFLRPVALQDAPAWLTQRQGRPL
jgi:NADP-dependent aldehyde dehydrogenase